MVNCTYINVFIDTAIIYIYDRILCFYKRKYILSTNLANSFLCV